MPIYIRETTIGDATVWVFISICANAVGAVVFMAGGAGGAGWAAAGVALRADADAGAYFDTGASVFANADGCADDFVAKAAWVESLALGTGGCEFGGVRGRGKKGTHPSATHGVQV